jgi:hypothetical protein
MYANHTNLGDSDGSFYDFLFSCLLNIIIHNQITIRKRKRDDINVHGDFKTATAPTTDDFNTAAAPMTSDFKTAPAPAINDWQVVSILTSETTTIPNTNK